MSGRASVSSWGLALSGGAMVLAGVGLGFVASEVRSIPSGMRLVLAALGVSLILVGPLLAAAGGFLGWRRGSEQLADLRGRRCGRCDYDLNGLPAGVPCPECGAAAGANP